MHHSHRQCAKKKIIAGSSSKAEIGLASPFVPSSSFYCYYCSLATIIIIIIITTWTLYPSCCWFCIQPKLRWLEQNCCIQVGSVSNPNQGCIQNQGHTQLIFMSASDTSMELPPHTHGYFHCQKIMLPAPACVFTWKIKFETWIHAWLTSHMPVDEWRHSKKDTLSYKVIYFIFLIDIFRYLYSMIEGKLVNSLTALICNQEKQYMSKL